MKQLLKSALIVCCVGSFAGVAMAQEGDRPPRGEADRRPAAERREEGRPLREGPPARGEGDGPAGRGEGPARFRPLAGADRPGAEPPALRELEVLRGYLELVDRFTRLSKDADTAGVAAVIQANDILRPRGADAVIEYFTKRLPEVKNPAVQRAIRLQLVEAYKRSNQPEKALEQLQALITGAPAAEAAPLP